MPFNVNDFRSDGLKLGGARPSLFEVQITLPTAIEFANPNAATRIPLLVRAAQLPAMTIDPVEVPYFGRKIKLAGDRTFADWTVTIMNDEDFAIRNVMEEWSNAINRIRGNTKAVNGNDYKGTAEVRQFSKGTSTGPIRTYIFNGIFPLTIDAIGLDWDTTNQIENFDVTFAYDWWEPAQNVDTGTPQATNYAEGLE